jgi:putative hydrolase of the HAD superfamily
LAPAARLRAVVFDFYGTLGCWSAQGRTGYVGVFEQFGYTLDPQVLDAYFGRYDGIEHVEHSTDAATYEAWVRYRLGDLTTACGVPEAEVPTVIEAMRAADRGEMVAYAEAAPTLAALRAAGLSIGVCSNWGWEIEGFLEQIGLLALIDVAVTSARAGARKPHQRIYEITLAALGVEPDQVLFVGDSWSPDVVGPTAAGMAAVHVWRPEERVGQTPPTLEPGHVRITRLDELLEVVALS